MLRKIIILASLSGLLAGCASINGPTPTPFPEDYLPTVVALTGRAAFATSAALTPTATETLVPTETPIPETPLPTLTPTPEPGFVDFAQIRFLSPGPMSYVGSPIQLQMLLVAGESEIVNIELLDESGDLMTGKLERITRRLDGVYRSLKFTFEIRGVSEQAWVIVSTKDEFGRMQALNSLQVFLISSGPTVLNPPGNIIYERVAFETPEAEAEVSGGLVEIRGRFWPFNTQPFFLDLIDEKGRILSTRVVTVDGIETQSFETTIPYNVTEPTRVRLSVRQIDPVLKRDIYIYTHDLTLHP
ncbi:MAG: hypothetical protein AB1649_08245 [Chloroflexota bacterium]